jgi:hypothetical protein
MAQCVPSESFSWALESVKFEPALSALSRLLDPASSFLSVSDLSILSSCRPGAQIHDSHHSETYDVGAARVIVFGVPLWLDVKPPRVILQVSGNMLGWILRWGWISEYVECANHPYLPLPESLAGLRRIQLNPIESKAFCEGPFYFSCDV